MKLINLLLIALSAASSAAASADENNKAALLRGTFNSAFNLIMSSSANPTCIAPGNHCNPNANAAAGTCCSGQAAGGGSYSCNCKAEHGSDAGPREAPHVHCTCEGNDDDVEEEKKEEDVMSTLSCAHNTGRGERDESCVTDDDCASCCCYSSNSNARAPLNTCQPTGWCNGFLEEEEDTTAVEEEEDVEEEEEEEDFATSSLSCVAPGHTGCEPGVSSANPCCTGTSAGGSFVCNCRAERGSDAGPRY